jgi:hypothetical protein
VNTTINTSNEKDVSSVLLYIVIFFQFFTIKIYSVIDVQISILLFVVLLYSQKRMPILSAKYFTSTMVLFAFLIYSLAVIFVSDDASYFESARIFRALASSILLYLLFEVGRFDFYRVSKILISIIFIHSVFIALEVLFPDVKIIMKDIVGFGKDLVATRAFGLLGSYDAAGAFLIIGVILCSAMYRFTSENKYIATMLLFWLSGFATGRFFMIIGSIFLIYYMWRYFFKTRFNFTKIYIALFLSIVGYLAISYALPLLVNAFLFSFDEEALISNTNFDDTGYYIGTMSVLQGHVILPDSLTGVIFGTGEVLSSGDIGFYKIIYSFGLVGLLFYIAYFYIIYFFIKNKISKSNKVMIVFPILLVLLIYNFKMQTFLSRGFHEILLIIILSLLYTDRKCRLR